MLTEKDTYQIEVTENDHIQVRKRTTIYRDGEPISDSFHRHVIAPGQDVSGEIGKVRRVAKVAHVPTVVAKYKAERDFEDAKEKRERDDTPKTRKAERDAKRRRDEKRRDQDDFEKAEDE